MNPVYVFVVSENEKDGSSWGIVGIFASLAAADECSRRTGCPVWRWRLNSETSTGQVLPLPDDDYFGVSGVDYHLGASGEVVREVQA